MKTSFKPTRGHYYHVVHETKSWASGESCYTLCGEFFARGEYVSRHATCPGCTELDNPLWLPITEANALERFVYKVFWPISVRSLGFNGLVVRDYVGETTTRLTRRGRVLVDDWKIGPVPMPDVDGVMHVRQPLCPHANCGAVIAATSNMSVSRYEKLRMIDGSPVISCLSCLAK